VVFHSVSFGFLPFLILVTVQGVGVPVSFSQRVRLHRLS
jgi:hypothetical protein